LDIGFMVWTPAHAFKREPPIGAQTRYVAGFALAVIQFVVRVSRGR